MRLRNKFALAAALLAVAAAAYVGFLRLADAQAGSNALMSLAIQRDALSIFAEQHTAIGYAQEFPVALEDLWRVRVNGRKIAEPMPEIRIPPFHKDQGASPVYATAPNDAGGWGYVNDPADAGFGRLYINCTHTDPSGKRWADY